MAKTYYTFRIRLANDKSVRIEKWGDDHKLRGEFYSSFRYQEKREEIDSQLKPVFTNELNNSLQARKLGEYLFEAIFDNVLRQEFVNFYQEVVRNQKQFLRIELDIDEVAMPDVAALPWEFMCLPASANLGECRFATDPNLVFSRRRPRSHSPNPIQLEKGEKLRIALAIAAPEGLGPVEYQEVQEALEILAHEQAQRIELLPIVNPATPTAIDKLLERKPHIFHFIGHGQMQNETGEEVGQIALVKKAFNKTKSLWMDADSFSELFNRWSPGVVLLQACESGMLSASKVFAGAASKIVQMNIPVVVAMQYEVSNATASEFAYEFYQRLAKGEPVDIAAQNGRRTIGLETVHRKRDFATPVIFMGVENGYLFGSEETGRLTDLLVKGSGISKGKQENSPDLNFSAIPSESIQQAYRKAFAPDADLWEESDISQILERLKENKCEGAFYQLLSQDENIDRSMRQKIQKEAKKHPEENKTRQTGKNFSEEKEYYLIATLEPAEGRDVRLNGWLVMGEHQDGFEYVNNCQSLLNGNETESGLKCPLNRVESILEKFILESCKYLLKQGKSKLTIEIFLPMNLLDKEVEWWNLTDFDNDKRPIGTMYPVRLRSVERLGERYLDLHLPQWKDKWKNAKSALPKNPKWEDFGHFDLMEDESFTVESLIYELDEKIGLKSTSCPPEHKRKDLFRAILKSALPIALWTRYNCPNRHNEMERLLNLQPLSCLCDSIKKKRMEAVAQKDENQKKKHLGSHLAVIWENPYRLPPDIMVELIAPGQ